MLRNSVVAARHHRRRRAYASHDNHEKINSWVSFLSYKSMGLRYKPPKLRYKPQFAPFPILNTWGLNHLV